MKYFLILILSSFFITSCMPKLIEIELMHNSKSGSLYLRNYGLEDYHNVAITIEPDSGPSTNNKYIYGIRVLKAGDSEEISERDFLNKLGERFPYDKKIYSVKIKCDEGKGLIILKK